MSAWYVMSAMGMYEIEPAGGRYWFGSPIFNRMELDIPAGKFTIIAQNNSSENRYIQHVWLNGEEYHKPYIEHSLIMQGGELRFEMGAEPALWSEVE